MSQTTERRPRGRVALLAAAVTFLVFAGTGVGHAAWTTSSAVSGTVAATNAGLSATLGAGLSGVTYPASATATATSVTISPLSLTNIGGAPLTLSLSATSTNAALAGAIQLRAWVRTGTTCPATVPTSGVVAGTLATPPSITGLSALPAPLAAGSATVLCLATNPATTVSGYAGQTTTATLTVTGAVGSTWKSAPTVTVTQSVAASSGFSPAPAARFQIFSQGMCIATDWGFAVLIRTTSSTCPVDQLSEWRFVAGPAGSYYIQRAYNSGGNQPERFSAIDQNSAGLSTAATTAAQRWIISARTDGTYRIESVSQPGRCLRAQTNGSVNLTPCNATSSVQSFTFTPVGNPVPATPHAITCSAVNPGFDYGYLVLSWPYDAAYQHEQIFRMKINGVVVTPGYMDNWNAASHLYPANLQSAGIAHGAVISVTIEVNIAGSGWSTVATRSISFTPAPNPASAGVVGCGS